MSISPTPLSGDNQVQDRPGRLFTGRHPLRRTTKAFFTGQLNPVFEEFRVICRFNTLNRPIISIEQDTPDPDQRVAFRQAKIFACASSAAIAVNL